MSSLARRNQQGPVISPWRRKLANLLIWVYALATIAALVMWLSRRIFVNQSHTSWAEIIFAMANIPATPSLVSVAGLAILTVGLQRHKRVALWIVFAMQFLGGLWAIIDMVFFLTANETEIINVRAEIMPLLIASMAISVSAMWLLIQIRAAFPARVRPGSWALSAGVLAAGLVLAIGAASILLAIWPDNSGPAWQQTLTVLMRAMGMTPPRSWDVHVGHLVPQVVSVIMVIALVAAILFFLRSTKSTDQWHPDNALAVRQLLASHGEDDSLGYFNTRRDKLVHFSPDGRAAVAYRVVAGVCLAAGDPLGAPDAWPAAIGAWEAEARRYGWVPAVLACSEAGARSYSQVLGFDILRLGDEAVLTADRFRLDSTAMTEVRRSVRRARREGLTVRIAHTAELDRDELAEIARDADAWRTGAERGFSMALGRFGDPADERMVVATVHTAAGQLVALQSFVPWGRHGLSLDLMRRSPEAPNGTNDFLVAELMAWGADHGITRVSLNFAFFRHVFAEAEDVAAAPLTKMNSQMLGLFDRFFQIQRLYRANAKYNPVWQPRYVALGTPLLVGQVAWACMIAEGFVSLPFMRQPATEQLALSPAQVAEVRAIEAPPAPEDDWHGRAGDQTRHRLRHLDELAAAGRPGYPVGRREAVRLADLTNPLTESCAQPISGRVRRIRDFGGVCFADLTDLGVSVQLLLDAATLGRDQVKQFARLVDTGDLIDVLATPGTSRNGTASLLVREWTMLAKAVRPVPWQGLADPEARARNRSLDLLVNSAQVDLLQARSRAIASVRSTLLDDGFHEVETPILGTTNGGATARPFRTHINAYDSDLVLRIAPELPLKRLLVAGMGSIFEIGRNFRNEGADATHNPEFTVVEAYKPYADYTDMRLLTQRIFQNAAVAVHGRAVMPLDDGSGTSVLTDISGDWPVVSVSDAVSAKLGREVGVDTDLDELLEIAHDLDIEIRAGLGAGAVLEELYSELVEQHTVFPTFYVDFPAETSPLTAPHRSKPGLVERWDLVASGTELGTAYSELADPLIQRSRLVEQSWLAAQGDAEAMDVDEDFLGALELGMPPTGGLGIGLDRLVMALTGSTIRQVLTFPFVRPR